MSWHMHRNTYKMEAKNPFIGRHFYRILNDDEPECFWIQRKFFYWGGFPAEVDWAPSWGGLGIWLGSLSYWVGWWDPEAEKTTMSSQRRVGRGWTGLPSWNFFSFSSLGSLEVLNNLISFLGVKIWQTELIQWPENSHNVQKCSHRNIS